MAADARLVLFFGRVLVAMMVMGALGTTDEGRLAWAAGFAGSALLAWVLIPRWRDRTAHRRRNFALPSFVAWRGVSAGDVVTFCERRIGLKVDAAAPAIVSVTPPARCILALAEDGLWVLEDESRLGRARIGRVVTCSDRSSLVAHVRHSYRVGRFELSWLRPGALVRGVMPADAPASQLAGPESRQTVRILEPYVQERLRWRGCARLFDRQARTI